MTTPTIIDPDRVDPNDPAALGLHVQAQIDETPQGGPWRGEAAMLAVRLRAVLALDSEDWWHVTNALDYIADQRTSQVEEMREVAADKAFSRTHRRRATVLADRMQERIDRDRAIWRALTGQADEADIDYEDTAAVEEAWKRRNPDPDEADHE